MKINIVKSALAGLAAIVSLTGISVAADCDSIGAEVKSEVAKAPSKVLVIVDAAITKNESCSCEIVKAAIEAADAKKDADLVREIVVTAVTAAQGMAATIAECAVAVSPSSAAEIKAGLSEVFEGAEGGAKDVYYSSKGAKEVVEEVEAPAPIIISGVYLINPVAPSAGGIGLSEEAIRELREREKDILRLLRDERNNGRRPGDSGTSRPTQS